MSKFPSHRRGDIHPQEKSSYWHNIPFTSWAIFSWPNFTSIGLIPQNCEVKYISDWTKKLYSVYIVGQLWKNYRISIYRLHHLIIKFKKLTSLNLIWIWKKKKSDWSRSGDSSGSSNNWYFISLNFPITKHLCCLLHCPNSGLVAEFFHLIGQIDVRDCLTCQGNQLKQTVSQSQKPSSWQFRQMQVISFSFGSKPVVSTYCV